MRLIDEAEADAALRAHGPGARGRAAGRRRTPSPGSPRSACSAGFIGQVADDQLGEIFPPRHPQPWSRVRHAAAERRRRDRALPDPGHARRAADDEHLPRRRAGCWTPRAVDPAQVARRADPLPRRLSVGPRSAARRRWTRRWTRRAQAGTKVAFTLSDSFVVDRHRDDLMRLLDERRIDILFANEAEIAALAGVDDLEAAVAAVAAQVADAGRDAQRGGRARDVAAASAPRFRPSRSRSWSTRPAPATCSPPASSPAKRAGWASSNRCGSARSAPPKSSSIMARAPRRTSGRLPATCSPSRGRSGGGPGRRASARYRPSPARRPRVPAPR